METETGRPTPVPAARRGRRQADTPRKKTHPRRQRRGKEKKEGKKENLKLTNNNRFLTPYVDKTNELRQENSMLEKEINKLKIKNYKFNK